MRGVGRVLGACWRGLWWICFPPLGWYMSSQARKRRRHNQLLRASARVMPLDRHGRPTGSPRRVPDVTITTGPPYPPYGPPRSLP